VLCGAAFACWGLTDQSAASPTSTHSRSRRPVQRHRPPDRLNIGQEGEQDDGTFGAITDQLFVTACQLCTSRYRSCCTRTRIRRCSRLPTPLVFTGAVSRLFLVLLAVNVRVVGTVRPRLAGVPRRNHAHSRARGSAWKAVCCRPADVCTAEPAGAAAAKAVGAVATIAKASPLDRTTASPRLRLVS